MGGSETLAVRVIGRSRARIAVRGEEARGCDDASVATAVDLRVHYHGSRVIPLAGRRVGVSGIDHCRAHQNPHVRRGLRRIHE